MVQMYMIISENNAFLMHVLFIVDAKEAVSLQMQRL